MLDTDSLANVQILQMDERNCVLTQWFSIVAVRKSRPRVTTASFEKSNFLFHLRRAAQIYLAGWNRKYGWVPFLSPIVVSVPVINKTNHNINSCCTFIHNENCIMCNLQWTASGHGNSYVVPLSSLLQETRKSSVVTPLSCRYAIVLHHNQTFLKLMLVINMSSETFNQQHEISFSFFS
jgi:hypothetical protein